MIASTRSSVFVSMVHVNPVSQTRMPAAQRVMCVSMESALAMNGVKTVHGMVMSPTSIAVVPVMGALGVKIVSMSPTVRQGSALKGNAQANYPIAAWQPHY